MRATVMYRAGDVRIENIPDAAIIHPTDAVIRITRACICGSDLWPYNELEPTEIGRRMGHEAIGVVEAVGAGVRTVKRGDVVVMPFAFSDGTCMFCDEGLQTSCIHGGFFGTGGEAGGAQAEALRIPQADGTLVVLPVSADDDAIAAHSFRCHGDRSSCGPVGKGRPGKESRRGRRWCRRPVRRHRRPAPWR